MRQHHEPNSQRSVLKSVDTWRSNDERQTRVDPASDGLNLRRREHDVVLLGRVERIGTSFYPDDGVDGQRRLLRLLEGDSEGRQRRRPVRGFDVVTREALPQVLERQERVVEVDRLDLKSLIKMVTHRTAKLLDLYPF